MTDSLTDQKKNQIVKFSRASFLVLNLKLLKKKVALDCMLMSNMFQAIDPLYARHDLRYVSGKYEWEMSVRYVGGVIRSVII